jgi:hypothetical protein
VRETEQAHHTELVGGAEMEQENAGKGVFKAVGGCLRFSVSETDRTAVDQKIMTFSIPGRSVRRTESSDFSGVACARAIL